MDENNLPPGGIVVEDPVWEPWLPRELADMLAAVDIPWGVAGGWALDLLGGQRSREHSDLEIAVPTSGFWTIRAALDNYTFEVIGAGRRWPLDSAAFDVMHQTWVREPTTGVYRLDVFREPHNGDTWICRRDASIRLRYRDIIRRTADGILFVASEIVLLFKAKHAKTKDEADLSRTLPILNPKQRSWLKDALEHAHPCHPWMDRL